MTNKIYFSDLTHTAQGINANTFPYGISCVMAYVMKIFGDKYDYSLYKLPKDLNKAIEQEMPLMLCMSNYSWNSELAYKFASLAKTNTPELITVFGGPNFPIDDFEKEEFLNDRPNIDFNISLEGELGLTDLIEKLEAVDFDSAKLKSASSEIINTDYIFNGKLNIILLINLILLLRGFRSDRHEF